MLTALTYLSLCEPLNLDVLTESAGEESVEQAEIDGLVRIEREGRELDVGVRHPVGDGRILVHVQQAGFSPLGNLVIVGG
ncbi:hypothetical protein [Gordonia oryzae]|uniref:hypothetical protein n=1 Tax=Gordonia oryzae TaxID=2487349 RepID=UPI0026AF3FD6